MSRIGFPELIIILVIVLIIFGVGRLPQVGGALGKAIREFRKESKGENKKEEVSKDTAKPKDNAGS